MVSELRYDAWGGTRYTSGTTATDFRYTGQREETSFGLYFYNARWYDSALGRFTSADSIIPGVMDVQAWDRYAYGLNNPSRHTDSSGHGVDCAVGEQYCEAGELNVINRALAVADENSNMTWYGLQTYRPHDMAILEEAGWTEGVFDDFRSGGVTSLEGTSGDAAVYLLALLPGGAAIRGGWAALASYATINAGGAAVSIGNNGLYQQAGNRFGYTYFEAPPSMYEVLKRIGLSGALNRTVISAQIQQGKPFIVSMFDPGKPGQGTAMELKLLEAAHYARISTANWLGANYVYHTPTWQWIGTPWD
jgi:RHS repeat-associated protein